MKFDGELQNPWKIYCLKFWFSLESGYLGYTATSNKNHKYSVSKSGKNNAFDNGELISASEFQTSDGTNILGTSSKASQIVELYGRPSLKQYDLTDSAMERWRYPNGVTYTLKSGKPTVVQVSRLVWKLFQFLDWGITLKEMQGSHSENRSTGAITGTEVKGIIQNDREVRVRVKLRIRWAYVPSGDLADVYDSIDYEINPHDSVIFNEIGKGIAYSKEKIAYDITVKSVTEL
jgi:hypothetical protein